MSWQPATRHGRVHRVGTRLMVAAGLFLAPACFGATPTPVPKPGPTLVAPVLVDPTIDAILSSGRRLLVFGDSSPVNTSHNPGLASTYLGQPAFRDLGTIRADQAHLQINGDTLGWGAGTCLLDVVANVPPGTSACNQGGFWDPSYRSVYPGQDGAAAFFGIDGLAPVARDAAVASFGRETLTVGPGRRIVVGTVLLRDPLDGAQVAALDAASGPMRIEANNGFFGYLLPPHLGSVDSDIMPVSADGRRLLVDNWTRAIEPTNSRPPGTPGGRATRPSLPYWTPQGQEEGTGILPDQVGMTNGSPRLPSYTVTIGGVMLVDAQYGGFRITDADDATTARYAEIVGVNNKTGHVAWNEVHPLDDALDGHTFLTDLIAGNCQNDDGKGLGVCGAMLIGGSGVKRIVVCDNAQTTGPEGGTDCVLDDSTTFGWKSTKSTGYVLWVDPGAAPGPRMVIDWNGNVATAGRVMIGTAAHGVVLDPGGDVSATGLQRSGVFTVAALPACTPAVLGAHAYASDGRKPSEAPREGSGVPVDCAPPSRGAPPAWLSAYGAAPVQN